jgi:cobalt-precorrin 5A hydrolase/precorrin-3B C17-methyltransferase
LQRCPAEVEVVGVPGVTAALAASALLGAPLGHDHALISLSDLHTPWPAIERRIRAAADGDFVVCFYNPRSADRHWQLRAALDILAERRPAATPVGAVRQASRTGQRVWCRPLAEFDPADVDMLTTVVVGSSQTTMVGGRMVTPRGYTWLSQQP